MDGGGANLNILSLFYSVICVDTKNIVLELEDTEESVRRGGGTCLYFLCLFYSMLCDLTTGVSGRSRISEQGGAWEGKKI